MDAELKIVWGLVGLLIGAGLLTYLTRGSAETPGYESGGFIKKSKKKRQYVDQSPLSAQDNEPTLYPKDV